MTPNSCELCRAERDVHTIEGVALRADKRARLRRVAERTQRNFAARINLREAAEWLIMAAATREILNERKEAIPICGQFYSP